VTHGIVITLAIALSNVIGYKGVIETACPEGTAPMTYLVRLLGEFSGEWQYLTDPASLQGVAGPAPWMRNASKARHFDTVEAAVAAKSAPHLNLNGLGCRAEIVDAAAVWAGR
jgi:hypothetical protein